MEQQSYDRRPIVTLSLELLGQSGRQFDSHRHVARTDRFVGHRGLDIKPLNNKKVSPDPLSNTSKAYRGINHSARGYET